MDVFWEGVGEQSAFSFFAKWPARGGRKEGEKWKWIVGSNDFKMIGQK